MINGKKTYCTVLSCDSTHCCTGSVPLALRTFGAMRVDMILAPGMDGLLAGIRRQDAQKDLLRVFQEARDSVEKNDSHQCLIMGHCNCRANPVSFEEHKIQLRLAKATVEGWNLFRWVELGISNPEGVFKSAA